MPYRRGHVDTDDETAACPPRFTAHQQRLDPTPRSQAGTASSMNMIRSAWEQLVGAPVCCRLAVQARADARGLDRDPLNKCRASCTLPKRTASSRAATGLQRVYRSSILQLWGPRLCLKTKDGSRYHSGRHLRHKCRFNYALVSKVDCTRGTPRNMAAPAPAS